MKRTWKALLTLGCGLALAGCATRQPLRGQEARGVDRKLSTYAYIEDGDLVTLIVGTRPARDKDGSPYLPIEIAVANRGLSRLILTPESFTLVDQEGNRYPLASPAELYDGYDMLDFDRNLMELESVVFAKFSALPRYPSNFSPSREVDPTRSSLVADLLALPKHGYMIDLLFFPGPTTGVRGRRFELFLTSPDLADPVFVKFEVL